MEAGRHPRGKRAPAAGAGPAGYAPSMGARQRGRRGRRGNRGGSRATVGVALVLVAAAGAALWATNREPSPPGNVLLVGDSLFFQSADELHRLVTEDGWTVKVEAGIGAGIEGGGLLPTDWVRHLTPIVEDQDPEVVVIELGTNGCGPSCEGVAREIDQVMETVEDADVVVWLTVRTGPSPEAINQMNGEIIAAAGRWDQLEVVPMHEWFTNHPELIDPDGVHLNTDGQRVMAEQVREAIRDRTD